MSDEVAGAYQAVKEIASIVQARAGAPMGLRGELRTELETELMRRLVPLVEDSEAWLRDKLALPRLGVEVLQLDVEQAPSLEGEHLVVRVWSCECGQRWDRRSTAMPPLCANCKAQMDAVEVPVRKLPDAFQHVSTPMADPVKFVKRLVRDIERTRHATVSVSDLGGFRENCVLALRWASEAAGHNFEKGRLQHEGAGWAGYVRWFADDLGTAL